MEHFLLKATEILNKGGVLLYPTDTIYSLGCDAFSIHSVERIVKMKQRKIQNPFILLASSLKQVQKYFKIEPILVVLEKIWPGSYTILLEPLEPKKFNPFILNCKVAIRVSQAEWLSKLFSVWNGFLVSTSANISNRTYKSDWDFLKQEFSYQVDLMIQNSTELNTIPSAILDWNQQSTGEQWSVLREGYESKQELLKKLNG